MCSQPQSNHLSSLSDEDDTRQNIELLKLRGQPEDIARENVKKITAIYDSKHSVGAVQTRPAAGKSGLSCILYPENELLASIPSYHRYVAWCINKYGVRKAAKHLGFSRMSFYRWLEKNGYKHKFTKGQ